MQFIISNISWGQLSNNAKEEADQRADCRGKIYICRQWTSITYKSRRIVKRHVCKFSYWNRKILTHSPGIISNHVQLKKFMSFKSSKWETNILLNNGRAYMNVLYHTKIACQWILIRQNLHTRHLFLKNKQPISIFQIFFQLKKNYIILCICELSHNNSSLFARILHRKLLLTLRIRKATQGSRLKDGRRAWHW